MLQIQGLIQYYGSKIVLNLPDWRLEKGERALLCGASGSGKTTLLHLIAGLLNPSEGQITVNQTIIHSLKGSRRDFFRGRHIGFIFQKPHLLPTLTVLDNLLLSNYMAGNPQNKNEAIKLLNQLQIKDLAGKFPHQISLGEAQRVGIARAMVNRPPLILADEPTASLDDENAESVIDLILEQTENQHTTLIISTHDRRLKEHKSAFKRLDLPPQTIKVRTSSN
jgi:putative ABC transport system ATP-binding protein